MLPCSPTGTPGDIWLDQWLDRFALSALFVNDTVTLQRHNKIYSPKKIFQTYLFLIVWQQINELISQLI